MAFVTLAEDTLADGDVLTDNFYHIDQGDRYPLEGAALTVVDDTYNIGASITVWKSVFCQNLNISDSIYSSEQTVWRVLTDFEIATSVERTEVAGLNGDVDKEYRIIFSSRRAQAFGVETWFHRMAINTDSTTSYGYMLGVIEDRTGVGTVTAARGSASYVLIDSEPDLHSWKGTNRWNIFHLSAATGKERTILKDETSLYAERWASVFGGYVWSNTSDNITTLQFLKFNTVDAGDALRITIFKRA